MSQQAIQNLEAALDSADLLYYRLVLLVGPAGSGKTRALASLASARNLPLINLNLELSAKLLEFAPAERAGNRLLESLRQILEKARGPVALDNIEILFDRGLRCDPLKMLQGLSRNRSIVASWNGSCLNGRLKYAEYGHSEYRDYHAAEAVIINMGDLCEGNL